MPAVESAIGGNTVCLHVRIYEEESLYHEDNICNLHEHA